MIGIQDFTADDVAALQKAIDADKFHPGEWKVTDFWNPTPDPEVYNPLVTSEVITDSTGPIAFVRFTKTLRISCIWNDGEDIQRNAKAIIHGIRDAIAKARASGFSEIIITTTHQRLATFFDKVMNMTKSGDEYILAV